MLSSRTQGWATMDTEWAAPTEVRSAGQPRPVRWLLVVSAFVCGIAVSGAVFAYAWSHESSGRQAAQERLGDQFARIAAVQKQVTGLKVQLRKAERTASERAQAISARNRRIGQLTAAERAEHARVVEAAGAAASAAKLASTLQPEISTLSNYVRTTPVLDPGYLESQIAYLGRQVSALAAEAQHLASLG
jgi:hypothetical protein